MVAIDPGGGKLAPGGGDEPFGPGPPGRQPDHINPMDFGAAAQAMGAVPQGGGAGGSLEELQAKFQQAYGQPPAQAPPRANGAGR